MSLQFGHGGGGMVTAVEGLGKSNALAFADVLRDLSLASGWFSCYTGEMESRDRA